MAQKYFSTSNPTHPISFDQLPDWIGAKDLRAYLNISRALAYELVHKHHPRAFGRHLRIPKELFRPVRGKR